jgi:hypothetical protein
MIHHGALLKIAADGRVAHERENIVPLAVTIGNGIIAVPVIEFMMVLIMRRSPGECREPIEQCYPYIRDVVQGGRFPHRHMVVIVGDNGDGDGEIEGQNIYGPVKTDFPLNEKNGSGKKEVQ